MEDLFAKREDEYKQRLIASGTPPEMASTIARKTFIRAGDQEGPMTSERKPTKKGRAATALSEAVSQTKAKATRDHSIADMQESQMSLFDIAPWADDMRAMPNDWLRSALFTVRNKRAPRTMMEKASIYHVHRDVTITYTGWELRAYDDELVLFQVLEYWKRLSIDAPVTFTFYEICKDLDWPINKTYYNKVDACLTRLQASAMQFTSDRIGHLESVSLVRRYRIVDKGNRRLQRCEVEIDPEVVIMFAGKYYTKLPWNDRRYLKLSPIARRMYDYFSTHKEPYPLTLESFRKVCGSDSTRPKKWREQVRSACTELNENDLVAEAWVNDDKLYCKRR